jgi:hypothetical protein
MTRRNSRPIVALAFTLAWYAFALLALMMCSVLFGIDAADQWPARVLLFPLALFSWMIGILTEWFGFVESGHLVLPSAFRLPLMVALPLFHVGFVYSVAYVLVGWWRAKKEGKSAYQRA